MDRQNALPVWICSAKQWNIPKIGIIRIIACPSEVFVHSSLAWTYNMDQYGSIWFKPLKCSKRLLQKSQLHLWAPLSLTQLQTRHVAQKNSNTWRFLGRMFPNLGTHLSVLQLNGRSFRMDREPGHIILKIARIADLFRRRVVIHRYTQEHALQIPPLGPSSGRPRSRRVVAIKPNWLSS